MQSNELKKQLKVAGCVFIRHGSAHEVWQTPLKTKIAIPHSTKIKMGVLWGLRRTLKKEGLDIEV